MVANYVPPLTLDGSILPPADRLGEIWPGVRGFAVMCRGRIYIPMIIATNAGSGDVGRFLDALSPRCSISNVTSKRLRGMLKRRKFNCVMENSAMGPFDRWDVPSKKPPRNGTIR